MSIIAILVTRHGIMYIIDIKGTSMICLIRIMCTTGHDSRWTSYITYHVARTKYIARTTVTS